MAETWALSDASDGRGWGERARVQLSAGVDEVGVGALRGMRATRDSLPILSLTFCLAHHCEGEGKRSQKRGKGSAPNRPPSVENAS